MFKAIDRHSGVDVIGYNITISTPGKTIDAVYTGQGPANQKPVSYFYPFPISEIAPTTNNNNKDTNL